MSVVLAAALIIFVHFYFRLIVISAVLTTSVFGYDFTLPNVNRNVNDGRNTYPRHDVIPNRHDVETSGWKAMYSSPTTDSLEEEAIAFEPRKTQSAIRKSVRQDINNKHIENIDRRQYVNGNTNSENNNNRPNNKSNNRANFDSYVQKEPEVLIVMPSSQFKKEVPSAYHHQNDGVSIKQNNDRQISLEDVEQNNSYGDKVVADSFRVPRRIHPYSTATSMYLAQENLFVAPRAFQVDQLPSTPQLNAIMNRAMDKVKRMVQELEEDKGKIQKS